MGTNLLNALIFITQTIVGLYLMFVLVRLLMQISQVDYYNPISQGIIRITDPLCTPIRRFLPTLWRIDTATLFFCDYFTIDNNMSRNETERWLGIRFDLRGMGLSRAISTCL